MKKCNALFAFVLVLFIIQPVCGFKTMYDHEEQAEVDLMKEDSIILLGIIDELGEDKTGIDIKRLLQGQPPVGKTLHWSIEHFSYRGNDKHPSLGDAVLLIIDGIQGSVYNDMAYLISGMDPATLTFELERPMKDEEEMLLGMIHVGAFSTGEMSEGKLAEETVGPDPETLIDAKAHRTLMASDTQPQFIYWIALVIVLVIAWLIERHEEKDLSDSE